MEREVRNKNTLISRILLLIGLVVLLIIPLTQAKEGRMRLLAVSEDRTDLKGNMADLYLEVRDGNGRVFLETFPLSKADTQISMRFAKQVACNNLPLDCNKYDFIYTLRSSSPVISGPSAGAAAAILTYSVLADVQLKEDVAITGTINAGGFIGAVGGVRQKIDAASEVGIKKVLIPGGRKSVSENNQTIDLVDYGKTKNVEVVEVSSLQQALSQFTGQTYNQPIVTVEVNKEYQELMKNISDDLCARSKQLVQTLSSLPNGTSAELLNVTDELLNKSTNSYKINDYYSAASYCFRTNLITQQRILVLSNLTIDDVYLKSWRLKGSIQKFRKIIHNKTTETLTDLQTLLIVDERIIEANDLAEEALQKSNSSKELIPALSAATERLYSASAWSNFYKFPGSSLTINKTSLLSSCEDKIHEAEERYHYVQLFIPDSIPGVKKEIERAADDHNNGRYEFCLGSASKAKAEADLIITLMGVPTEQLPNATAFKLDAAKQAVAQSQKKGIFPILGYSYYTFAQSLALNGDYQTAMLFSEYAIEFSNLDMYFQELQDGYRFSSPFPYAEYMPYILGGILMALILLKFFEKE